MHPNETCLERFYSSFRRRDHAGMLECYAPDIVFSDPVFVLKGKRVGAMWQMLCEAAPDLEIVFREIQADEGRGTARWEARYRFSSTGRNVHNVIEAEFIFRDGAIVHHRDRFDFWRWSRMALGPVGLILGWSPWLQNRVRGIASRNLERFIRSHPSYQ